MADRANISVETLHQLINYNAETGELIWRRRPREMFDTKRHCSVWNARYAGKPALACGTGGYRHGAIFDRSYKAHRVAWALHYGAWPEGVLDHINGNGRDNRICNLREVDQAENMRNLPVRRQSASGVPGVSWFARKQKWQVRVGTTHIGYFADFDQAVSARHAAAKAHGYHPNHGRK